MTDSVSSGGGTGNEVEAPRLEDYVEMFLTILIVLNSRRKKRPASSMWENSICSMYNIARTIDVMFARLCNIKSWRISIWQFTDTSSMHIGTCRHWWNCRYVVGVH